MKAKTGRGESDVESTLSNIADIDIAPTSPKRFLATPTVGSGNYTGRVIAHDDIPSSVTNNLPRTVVVEVTRGGQVGGDTSQVTIKLQIADGSYVVSEWDCRVTIFDDTTNFVVVKGSFGDNGGDAQVAPRGTTTALYDCGDAGNFGETGKQDYAWRAQSDGEILLDITGDIAQDFGIRVGPAKWSVFSQSYAEVQTITIIPA